MTSTESGETREARYGISSVEGSFLQDKIRQSRPKISLEIGCAYGVSSLFICEALQEVGAQQHIIIDPYQIGSSHAGPDPGYEGIGLLNLKRAGFDHLVKFYPELSYRCLPRLEHEDVKIDFAFVDGMHTFDYAFVDFFFIDKMLRVGGIVVFDDILYPSVRKLLRFILCNLPYSTIGPDTPSPNFKHRVATAAVKGSSSLQRLLKPEIQIPDEYLGLPSAHFNFVALRKNAQDELGDGRDNTRRWDFHREF